MSDEPAPRSTDPLLEQFERLRAPFPEKTIGSLFKAYQRTDRTTPRQKCRECNQVHAAVPGVHLSYVGHAAVTDRLNSVDPFWNWQPLAYDESGLPRFVKAVAGNPVGLWIKLTVLDKTVLGYGSVEGGVFDAEKQLIGDAIRNAAMRFGVALDLWSKDELESRVQEGDEELDRKIELAPAKPRAALPKGAKSKAPDPERAAKIGQSSELVQALEQRDEDKQAEDARMAAEVEAFAAGEPETPPLTIHDIPFPEGFDADLHAWAHEHIPLGAKRGWTWDHLLALRPGKPDPEGLAKAMRTTVRHILERAQRGRPLMRDDYRYLVVAQFLEPKWKVPATASDLLESAP